MANIKLENVNKVYDNKVQAVFDFNLDIEDKEFIVFVGPSGCGKSTTLRMIAGLEEITSGEISIDGKIVNDVPSKDRDIAMVFQSYALYPHMSVRENMMFGLKIKKVDKDEINRRVSEAAEILEITDYLDRKPKALSGGQRQRVALGRAIVRNAKVFLMDEPLSNLDAKLRSQMRTEIIKIHERIGGTTIYVTHDQVEAMTMATRLVIMKDGYIQQIGAPRDVYQNPKNMFVAGFLGSPAMNFIDGVYDGEVFRFEDEILVPTDIMREKLSNHIGKDIVLGIRPEDIHVEQIVHDTYPNFSYEFKVSVSELLGNEQLLYGTIRNSELVAKINSRDNVKHGDKVCVTLDAHKIHLFDKESGEVIE